MPLVLLIAAGAIIYAIMNSKQGGGGAAPVSRADFFKLLRPVALAVERETGIKADLGMVQAAHESAYGSSGLSSPGARLEVRDNNAVLRVGAAYNLFGFTAEPGTYWRSQNRPFVAMPTTEYNAAGAYKTTRPFRAYSSWEESYRDWARLMGTSRYKEALAFAKAGNLKGFAAALQKAGYATDPAYAAKLEGVARAGGIA